MKSKQSYASVHSSNPLMTARTSRVTIATTVKYPLQKLSISTKTKSKPSLISTLAANSPATNSDVIVPSSMDISQMNFSINRRQFVLPLERQKHSLNQISLNSDRFTQTSRQYPLLADDRTSDFTPRPNQFKRIVRKVIDQLRVKKQQGVDGPLFGGFQPFNPKLRITHSSLHLNRPRKMQSLPQQITVVEQTLLGAKEKDPSMQLKLATHYKQPPLKHIYRECVEAAKETQRICKDLTKQENIESPDDMYRSDLRELDKVKTSAPFRKNLTARQPVINLPSESKPPLMPYFDLKTIEENIAYKDERKDFIARHSLARSNIKNVSPSEYFSCMKNMDKLQQFQKLYNQPDNVYLSLLKASHSNETMPRPLNFIKDGRSVEKIDSSRLLQTAKSSQVFSEALVNSQSNQIKSINLSSNGLRNQSVPNIINNLPRQIQNLNLSDNLLDFNAIEILVNKIEDNLSSLKVLNLESNKFGDKGCKMITESLAASKTILHLNLSKNNLTSLSCDSLGYFLRKSGTIQEMYLHYNSIDERGAVIIFKSLLRNTSIKVFDISFNVLGSSKQVKTKKASANPSEVAIAIGKVISKPHIELIHLDLSNNGFSEADSKEISKSLEGNQYIFGFHFEGNSRKYIMDPSGFLVYPEEQEAEIRAKLKHVVKKKLKLKNKSQKTLEEDDFMMLSADRKKVEHLLLVYESKNNIRQEPLYRRINSTNTLPLRKHNNNIQSKDICWICDGWQEFKFTWTPHKSGSIKTEPIYVHISFEDYKLNLLFIIRPILMVQSTEEFYLYKMCPPNTKIQYFFSNPVLGMQTCAKNQLVEELHENDPLRVEPKSYIYNQEIELEGQLLTHINYAHIQYEKPCIDAIKHYHHTFYSKPREETKTFEFTPFKKSTEVKWSIENSLFNNCQADNDAVINECFEFDFNCSKIPRLVKEAEVDNVRETLRKLYKDFFNAYKYYASYGAQQMIPCVSIQAFNDLIFQTKVLDNNRIKSTDIEVNFLSTNGKDIKFPNLVDKALVRYQMMEIFVRISIDKYYRTGVCQSINQSIKKIMVDDGLQSWFQEFDSAQFWRDDRYWHQECDVLLKKRLPMLRVLYKFTAAINPKNKYYKNIWVAAKDFKDLFVKCGLASEHLSERDMYLAFLLSIPTQVDELNNHRHYQMNFYEFLEGLARVADKLSIHIPKANQQVPLKLEERRLLPLNQKLEALLLIIYYRIGDQVKKACQGLGDQDLMEFDSSILGFKKARLRQSIVSTILVSPNINTRSNKMQQSSNNKRQIKNVMNFSDSSEGDSDSDSDEFDPVKQEALITEQLKVANDLMGIRSNVSSKDLMKKGRIDRLKDNYTLVSIVRYLRNAEVELIRMHLREAKTQTLTL